MAKILYKSILKHRSPTFSSFKIGADINLKDELLSPNLWSCDMSVSEFNFFEQAETKLHMNTNRNVPQQTGTKRCFRVTMNVLPHVQ